MDQGYRTEPLLAQNRPRLSTWTLPRLPKRSRLLTCPPVALAP